ncbi:hypothetical protein BKA69DRAFT_1128679 [Paraphysoderma sedebokerense]|nr:hypothetical protein BKA69DRAFT_1128679 [Paraphysoderma sedebokerense]
MVPMNLLSCTLRFVVLVFLSVLITPIVPAPTQTPIPKSLIDLALKYAPLYHFHPKEIHYPSTIDFFLSKVLLNRGNHTDNQLLSREALTQIVKNGSTDDMFLTTPEKVKNGKELPWFKGQRITENPKVYIMIVPRDNGYTIFYYMFFPYNRGKAICFGGRFMGNCVGVEQTLGNHVGDWEGLRIHFEGTEPKRVVFKYHSFNQTLSYTDPRVKKTNETHIQTYVALGSHGMNYEPKNRIYHRVGKVVPLIDEFGEGPSWKTWENFEIYMKSQDGTFVSVDRGIEDALWWNFKGKWGNPRQGCKIRDKISKELCDELQEGPDTPGFW